MTIQIRQSVLSPRVRPSAMPGDKDPSPPSQTETTSASDSRKAAATVFPVPPTGSAPISTKKPLSSYTGPLDGDSHYDPKRGPWLQMLTRIGVWATARVQLEGRENIPEHGSSMLCFNHQSYMDPPLVSSLSTRDWRFMASIDQFSGLAGKMMANLGAFPVDRDANPTRPLEVAKRLLDQGKGVGIFPEGGIFKDGSIHSLKEGTALIALRSKCETLVPGAIHYKAHETTRGERLGTYVTATAVTAGAIALALVGGPALVISTALTGLVTGAVAGGGIGALRTGLGKDIKQVGEGVLKGALPGAITGATLGALGTAFLAHPLLLAAPLAGVAGLLTLATGKALNRRLEAHVAVGSPIAVEPYREMSPKKGRAALTADLHQSMVALKSDLDARYSNR